MKILYLFACSLVFVVSVNAQYYLGYSFQNWGYQVYTELDSATVSSATGEDGAENITLPFMFRYMGVYYSTARISVNGWLELGQTYTGLGSINDLASTTDKPFISPLWDDLYDDAVSEIKYKTLGVAPARIFVVEWKDINAGFDRKSFQVRLYEIDGTIEFRYGPQSGDGYGLSASIGMNDHIGGINHFISITPPLGYPDTTVANNNIDSFDGIGNNTVFDFIPAGKQFNITTVQITDDVIRGAVNQPIICILVTSHMGVLTMPSVTAVSLSTNGTTDTGDILNAKLFNTGRNPNFSTLYQSGNTINSPNGNFTINGGGGLYDYATNYIWLTYDVSPTAQIGNVLDAECFQLSFDLTWPRVPDTTAPTGNREIVMGNGLSGTYTVGNNGDFTSLTAIRDSLVETFLNGPVTIEMLNNYNPAVENYPIVIPFINGSSAQNEITIHPAQDATDVIINSNQSATIIFDGATNISIDGRPGGIGENKALSIINENQNGSAILITGNSRNIDIMNSNILGSNNSTDGAVIQSFYNGYHNYSDSISIYNCFIGKSNAGRPANGIYFGPGDYPVAKHWDISKSVITDFLNTGINFTRSDECYVQDSKIYLTEASNRNKVVGIIIKPQAFMTHILRNSIFSLSISDATSNIITGIEVPFTEYIDIYNNFVSLSGNEYSTVTGIDFNGENHSFNNFYNNSIYIYGDCLNSNNSYCFRRRSTQYYAGLSLKLLNNIFINKRNNVQGTGHHYSIAIEDERGLQQIDHNDYFASGNGGVLGRWLGNDINTLIEWKNSTQMDTFSISKNVYFTSDIDLHLTGNSLGDPDLIGEPLSVIPNDIDQEIRNPYFPYMGADENLDYPLPVELISFSARVSGSSVLLDWSTSSETNNKGFEIERNFPLNLPEGETFGWEEIGFVQGNGTTARQHSYSFIDENLLAGKYKYRLKQIDFDGTFEYSNILDVEVDLPNEFSLQQNYPNPFNPTTSIQYSVGSRQFVKLKVYDVLGNEVATLINEEKPTGEYEVKFDGKNFSSGIYYYRLQAGNYIETKEMILLK
ncbi:hypothetical protein BMS3Abin03_00872 [bacterium BMS3Abin03]|nr:hypothetical protein BMS3Abin03_00872 [bacterium BMS3Abin03]